MSGNHGIMNSDIQRFLYLNLTIHHARAKFLPQKPEKEVNHRIFELQIK